VCQAKVGIKGRDCKEIEKQENKTGWRGWLTGYNHVYTYPVNAVEEEIE
jgi:hypothetical protein